MIEFICCGETNYVKSIDDCNLVGDFKIILNILNKCLVYKDHMEDHVYKPGKSKTNDDTWYTKYAEMLSYEGCIIYEKNHYRKNIDIDGYFNLSENTQLYIGYVSPCYVNNVNESEFFTSLPLRYKNGSNYKNPVYSDKPADCVYGTKEHLENWKYFVFNNKLPLFINICLIISQNNVVKPYIPWLTDKQYTDEEIYTLLNISPVEQQFIDNTLKKYERNSKWFKRYMIGKNADK